MNRGQYDEILMSSLNPQTRKQVRNLVEAVAQADKVDEHGNWSFGIEMDNKGRGSALNWDLYAVGRDYHSRRTLAIVQVRQYVKRAKNWWPEIRKSYFLIGRNEDETVFAHPVQAQVVRRAINDGRDPIRAAQRWIFGAEYEAVVRQGDVALVPLKRAPRGEFVDAEEMILQDSHRLQAAEFRMNGNLYARDPEIEHVPGTHPGYRLEGWYKVMVGQRADFYSFAAPTVD